MGPKSPHTWPSGCSLLHLLLQGVGNRTARHGCVLSEPSSLEGTFELLRLQWQLRPLESTSTEHRASQRRPSAWPRLGFEGVVRGHFALLPLRLLRLGGLDLARSGLFSGPNFQQDQQRLRAFLVLPSFLVSAAVSAYHFAPGSWFLPPYAILPRDPAFSREVAAISLQIAC